MSVESIHPEDSRFYPWRENYMAVSSHRRAQNILKAFNEEGELQGEYAGRELLEMIQNADDQESDELNIVLNSEERYVELTNSGPRTIPFSARGIECLIACGTSEKKVSRNRVIGSKGKGFRSLLNWADGIEIWSNGIHCEFSDENARAAWQEVRGHVTEGWVHEREELEKELAKICGAEVGTVCPVSILMAPALRQDTRVGALANGPSTTIRVHYKDSCHGDVMRQIDTLAPQLLLFVNSLRKISVSRDGEMVKELRRDEWQIVEETDGHWIKSCSLMDGECAYDWFRYHRALSNGHEISFAWKADLQPIVQQDRVAYSYFPTTFQLKFLPCILHATFQLSSSRNGINDVVANHDLMRLAGETLVDVAAWIAKRVELTPEISDDVAWFPYRLLKVGETGQSELLRRFKNGVEGKIPDVAVFPVVSQKYVKRSELTPWGKMLADCLVKSGITNCFPNHPWRGFALEGLGGTLSGSAGFTIEAEKMVGEMLKRVSAVPGNYSEYREMLESFLEVATANASQQDYSLACLPDTEGNVVPKSVIPFVNAGQLLPPEAAKCLNIRYVNTMLVNEYKTFFEATPWPNQQGWDGGRELCRHLKRIVNSQPSDINPIKELIVKYSRNWEASGAPGDMDARERNFKIIVAGLYSIYKKNTGMEPLSRLDFCVVTAEGSVKPASSVCLWDETNKTGLSALLNQDVVDAQWRLKLTLGEWCGLLGASTAEERETVRAFMKDFLGVSLGLPWMYAYCGDDAQYVRPPHVETNDNSSACFTQSKFQSNRPAKGEPRHDKENVVPYLEDAFLRSLRNKNVPEATILGLLFKDPETRRRLRETPTVWGITYGREIPCPSSVSYMAYKVLVGGLHRRLCQYLDPDLVTGDERRLKELASEVDLDEARMVLKQLNISRKVEDLPAEALYKQLAMHHDARRAQSAYAGIRRLLKLQVDQRRVTEEQCNRLAKSHLLQLFARKGRRGELKMYPREEIFYWDNDIVSRTLLDKLPKLEIGKRVGAASVQKLFAVKQLTKDDVVSVEGWSAQKKVWVEEFEQYLESRRIYILAARLRGTESSLDAEAKKLKVFNPIVVEPADQVYRVEGLEGASGLKSGDVLQLGGQLYLCSDHRSWAEANADPAFLDAIVEALCIVFGLSGTQIESSFREVLLNSDEGNLHYRDRQIDPETWENLLAALGLSVDDRLFWDGIAQALGKTLSDDNVTSLGKGGDGWLELVNAWSDNAFADDRFRGVKFSSLGAESLIEVARRLGLKPIVFSGERRELIKEFVSDLVEDVRLGMSKKFTWALHQRYLGDSTLDKCQFCVEQLRYEDSDGSLLDEIVEQFMTGESPADVKEVVSDLFLKKIEERFNVRIDPSCQDDLAPLPEYGALVARKITDRIDASVRSLLYFPGNEQAIKEALDARDREQSGKDAVEILPTSMEGRKPIIHVLGGDDLKDIPPSPSGKEKKQMKSVSRSGTHYTPQGKKEKLGLDAEKLVIAMLEQWKAEGKCVDFWCRSANANQDGMFNDGCHYDFVYQTENGEMRRLDSKAYSGSRFLMSTGEYNEALRNPNLYDIALVEDGHVYVLKSPFSRLPEYRNKIFVETETYSIGVRVMKDREVRSAEDGIMSDGSAVGHGV